MGKGSTRRQEDLKKIWDNWDATFGKKDKKEDSKPLAPAPADPGKKDTK